MSFTKNSQALKNLQKLLMPQQLSKNNQEDNLNASLEQLSLDNADPEEAKDTHEYSNFEQRLYEEFKQDFTISKKLATSSLSQHSEASQEGNKSFEDKLKEGKAKLLNNEEGFTQYSRKSIQSHLLSITNQQIQRDEQNQCIKNLYGNFPNMCQSLGDYNRYLFTNQELFISLGEILQNIEDEEVQKNIQFLTEEYKLMNEHYDRHYPGKREAGLNRILPQQVLKQRMMRLKKLKKIKSILQKDYKR